VTRSRSATAAMSKSGKPTADRGAGYEWLATHDEDLPSPLTSSKHSPHTARGTSSAHATAATLACLHMPELSPVRPACNGLPARATRCRLAGTRR